MASRRDFIIWGMAAPWLVGCGGDGNSDDGAMATSIPADDWLTGTPESQGVLTASLQALVAGGTTLPYLYSLVVIRNGVLVGEQYYAGAKSSDLRHVASCTKTVSGLLTGIALNEGRISSTSAMLSNLLASQLAATPNAYSAGTTLQQLLNMRSDQAWDENTQLPQLDAAQSATAFALALPSDGMPRGYHWNYSTASAHLISPILKNAYGMDELAIANAKLFGPLGIQQVAWQRDPSGEIRGSYGLQMRTRDLAKIGWMSMQGGQWQGRSVVPPDWLSVSQTSITFHVPDLGSDGAMTHIGYGNLWWTGTLGGQPVVLAWGHGGQFAILVPGLQLLVATQAVYDVSMAQASAQETAIHDLVGNFIATLS